MKFVNVVIDNKSNSTDIMYTYACDDDSVKTGSKVYVPFARSKQLREGYVTSSIDDITKIEEEVRKKLKKVERIDQEVSLTEEMIRTAMWMK